MTHYRDGHWRTSINGIIHWVDGHSVNRADWSGNSRDGFGILHRPAPAATLGMWGSYEAGRLESYTVPNASCPVCGDKVFFYQSENGGRVFFDPPLGPPWSKHPCTDNQRLSAAARSHSQNSHMIPRFKPHKLRTAKGVLKVDERGALARINESGWHPLLDIKQRNLGRWWKIDGFDPIDGHRCTLIIDIALNENSPTYILVQEPQRLTCKVEQPCVDENDEFQVTRGQGWFGVDTLDEARIAKRASKGDATAMREYGRNRSYRFLGDDNRISDVSNFVDLIAAKYWLKRASDLGMAEATLEYAYLLDLIAWEASNFKRSEIRRSRAGSASFPNPSCVRTACLKVKARLEAQRALQRLLNLGAGGRLGANHLKQIEKIDQDLLEMSRGSLTPRFGEAIRLFVSAITVAGATTPK